MAREGKLPFWNLRETQALLDELDSCKTPLIDAANLHGILSTQTSAGNPHHALLAEALDDYSLETGTAELPPAYFRNWLAEWGREARRRQHGLLLVTAHSAKGLEFDHVIVADGDWSDDDPAALTRLYYVAMTRARQTLILARLEEKRHPMVDLLDDGAYLLRRSPADLPAPPVELFRRYLLASLGQIHLSYAGNKAPDDEVHAAISGLRPGDPLRLEQRADGWHLFDQTDKDVGLMAKAFKPPSGMACIAAQVAAILVRDRSQSDPSYRPPRCEQWEVVVPELVFAPADAG